MNRLSVFLLTVAMGVALGLALGLSSVVSATGRDELPDLKAKSLTIVGADGKGIVAIVPTEKGPGIWLTSPSGQLICITAIDDHMAVCLMHKETQAARVALAMDKRGNAFLQMTDSDGNVRIIDERHFK